MPEKKAVKAEKSYACPGEDKGYSFEELDEKNQ